MSDREVLIQQIKTGRLACLIGIDLPSDYTKLPSGAEIAHGLAALANVPVSDSLARVAQSAKEKQDYWPYQYLKQIAIPSGQSPGQLHTAIAQLHVPLLMTAAYDDGLKDALVAAGHSLNHIVTGNETWQDGKHNDLLPLCGDMSHLELVAVAAEDYAGLTSGDRAHFFERVGKCLKQNAILMLGCDPRPNSDFDRYLYPEIFNKLGGFAQRGYLVWPDPTPSDITRWAKRRVTLIDADPLQLVESLAVELQGVQVKRVPTEDLIALQSLVELLGHAQPNQAEVNTALAKISPAQKPGTITITFRLWLSESNTLQSILDIDYQPNLTHYYGKPFDTSITLQRLQEWARTAENGRLALKPPSNSIQQESIDLFDAIVTAENREAYAHALRDSKLLDMTVSIVIALDDKKGRLAPMPWELLHDGQVQTFGSGFLGLYYPVYRLPTSVSSLKRVSGGIQKALIVAADPTQQLDKIDAEAGEIENMLKAAHIQVDKCLSGDDIVGDVDAVCDLIRDGGYQLLHFIGHALFNPDNPDQSQLILGKAMQPDQFITASTLAQVARNSQLVFVFISACEGAGHALALTVPWQEAGLVDALVRAGVPATIGMQWIVGNPNSQLLASRFYTAVSAGAHFEDALMDARWTLRNQNQPDWANPILIKRHGTFT